MNIRLVKLSSVKTRIEFSFEGSRADIADFKGESGEVSVRYDGAATVILAGLGPESGYSDHCLRSAAANAVRKAAALKRRALSMSFPKGAHGHAAALEGVLLGGYVFDTYLKEKPDRVGSLEVISAQLTAADIRRAKEVCAAVCYARDLVNENAGVVTPAYLAAQARLLARGKGVAVEVLDERQLRAKGLGLLAAVGQGSPTPPRLVLMHYRGNPRSKDVTAIVGKGITFDSGGLNLKPSGHIETMRIDMAGAAAVLGVMRALSALRLKINVTGVIAAAHNAIDGASYMPGDIFRAYGGKTVEICNTDAEGRLALADAIGYVRDRVKPARIIDLATLTGGILITFADVLCGLFASDDTLAADLTAAGEATRERVYRLPILKEFSDSMKGDRSDLRNLSTLKRGYASSITGAAFIREFAGDTPWAHLDIAGTAFNETDARAEIPKYATGFGVRLLMRYLESRV